MKIARTLLALMLPALMLCGCSLPEISRITGSRLEADQIQELSLAEGVRAVAARGSVYHRCEAAGQPGIVLEEGRLVVEKTKDGEVVNLFAGPAHVKVLGTTVLVQKRGSVLCVVVVEGRTRVNWGNRIGEYQMLGTGQMLMMDEGRPTLPGPLLVNLGQLVSKEELLSPKFLSSEKMSLIDAAVKQQAARLAAGRLVVRNAVAGTGPLGSMQGDAEMRGNRTVSTRINTSAAMVLSSPTGAAGAGSGSISTAGGVVGGVKGTVGGVTGTVGGVAQGASSTVGGAGSAVGGVTGAVSQVIGGLGLGR